MIGFFLYGPQMLIGTADVWSEKRSGPFDLTLRISAQDCAGQRSLAAVLWERVKVSLVGLHTLWVIFELFAHLWMVSDYFMTHRELLMPAFPFPCWFSSMDGMLFLPPYFWHVLLPSCCSPQSRVHRAMSSEVWINEGKLQSSKNPNVLLGLTRQNAKLSSSISIVSTFLHIWRPRRHFWSINQSRKMISIRKIAF